MRFLILDCPANDLIDFYVEVFFSSFFWIFSFEQFFLCQLCHYYDVQSITCLTSLKYQKKKVSLTSSPFNFSLRFPSLIQTSSSQFEDSGIAVNVWTAIHDSDPPPEDIVIKWLKLVQVGEAKYFTQELY